MKRKRNHSARLSVMGACLGAIVASTAGVHADSATDGTTIDKLAQENKELKQRLEALESVAQKEGLLGSADASTSPVKSLSDITMSGFVTSSYFYDSSANNNAGHASIGSVWNRQSGSFSLNKVKLTLASKPVERSGDTFEAAFRVSLMYGEDVPIVDSGSAINGFENIREAYVEMNVPIGTGLNVKAGELISLLNYESGDGGAVNDNFSQGYQWFYTGNGPAEGVQIGYTFTDWLDVKVRVQNGLYAGPVDGNFNKLVMAAIGIKPNDKLWFSLIGYTGRENTAFTVQGGSLLAGWSATDKLHFGTELDYMSFDFAHKDSPVWSTGAWISYALTEKVTAALRAEFISDKDGVDMSADPLGFAANTGQDISSVAFTLDFMPLPNIKIQPEIRYDHSSLKTAFGTKGDRVVVGTGVSYLF